MIAVLGFFFKSPLAFRFPAATTLQRSGCVNNKYNNAYRMRLKCPTYYIILLYIDRDVLIIIFAINQTHYFL